MLMESYLGQAVYCHPIGQVMAEVYHVGDTYQVFLVGEHVSFFLGSAASLEDCKEEVRLLGELVEPTTPGEITRHRLWIRCSTDGHPLPATPLP